MSAIKMILDTGVAVLDVFGLRPMFAAVAAILFSIVVVATFWQAIRNR